MKNLLLIACVAVFAVFTASCNRFKSEETPIGDKCMKYTAPDGQGGIVFGVKDALGKPVLDPVYQEISYNRGHYITIAAGTWKYRLFDAAGKDLLSKEFKSIDATDDYFYLKNEGEYVLYYPDAKKTFSSEMPFMFKDKFIFGKSKDKIDLYGPDMELHANKIILVSQDKKPNSHVLLRTDKDWVLLDLNAAQKVKNLKDAAVKRILKEAESKYKGQMGGDENARWLTVKNIARY